MIIRFKNRSASVSVWAKECGISVKTLRSRIELLGWPVSKALTTEVVQHPRYKKRYPKLYGVWVKMRGRCLSKTNRDYKHYGGRGIKISTEWDDFNQFFIDMGPSYKEGLELERINNDDGYTAQNCKWATRKEQVRNRRITPKVTIHNETKSIGEWAEISGVARDTIKARIKRGWNTERAVFGEKMIRKVI